MRLLSCCFLMAVIATCNRATAQSCSENCEGYFDAGQFNCSGAGGCKSFYERYLCGPGCTCGSCDSHGSQGQCCGQPYYEAVIYPNGESCDEVCGDGTRHARIHMNRLNTSAVHTVDLRQDYSPGLIMLKPTESYREPIFGYAYNRCDHSYRLVFEVEKIEKHGGL
jgi:hypothetical protein